MNDATTNPTLDKSSSNFKPKITFRDDLTRSDQEIAERSVTAHMVNTQEKVAKLRAREAEQNKLTAAINAPLEKLVQADPDALKTLKLIHEGPAILPDPNAGVGGTSFKGGSSIGLPVNSLPSEAVVPFPRTVVGSEVTTLPSGVTMPTFHVARTTVDVMVPPYDFSWSWFSQLGNPPFEQFINDATGGVGVHARSGSVEGGASGFVEVHAGFGLILRTARPITAVGRSFRIMEFAGEANAVGLFSSGTTEGGMEFTAFEDGQLLQPAPKVSMWRHRISPTDRPAKDIQGPFAVTEPSELAFTMNPGHEYTFNVGIWVFTDREPGLGAGAALSLLQGKILSITIERF